MSGRIFVSYARTDSAFALKLAHHLRDAGVELWIDQLDIPTGARWDRAIEDALRSAEAMLLLLSPDAVASDNVLDEVAYAIDHKKIILPVLHKACEVPLRLRRLHQIDFTGPFDAATERCLRDVRQLVPNAMRTQEALPIPLASPPPPAAPVLPSAAFGTDGTVFAWGIWRCVSLDKWLYLWTPDAEHALEVPAMNGWVRIRAGGQEFALLGAHSPSKQSFGNVPWRTHAAHTLHRPALLPISLNVAGDQPEYGYDVLLTEKDMRLKWFAGPAVEVQAGTPGIAYTSHHGGSKVY